jgi:hypothetical protein
VHFDWSGNSGYEWRSQAAGFIRSLILGKLSNITREIKKIRKEISYIRCEKHRGAVTDEEIRLRGWDKVMEEWYENNAWRYIDVARAGEWVEQQAFQCVDLLSLILELCAELAKEPIRVPTGQKRMVKRIRKQPIWLTDESDKITHPQPPSQEMTNRMARLLKKLPPYTARVAISTQAEIEEHTIRTLEPEKGIGGAALQERVARIQTYNRTPDERGIRACRPRQEIEEEIRKRQEQCSQPPEAEPPISRHPPR